MVVPAGSRLSFARRLIQTGPARKIVQNALKPSFVVEGPYVHIVRSDTRRLTSSGTICLLHIFFDLLYIVGKPGTQEQTGRGYTQGPGSTTDNDDR